LLLNRAGAGDVNLIGVRQKAADLLKKFMREGSFEIVRSLLVRVGALGWVFGVTEDGKCRGLRIGANDGGMVIIHPNPKPPFGFL
jgi:hypothetical protein